MLQTKLASDQQVVALAQQVEGLQSENITAQQAALLVLEQQLDQSVGALREALLNEAKARREGTHSTAQQVEQLGREIDRKWIAGDTALEEETDMKIKLCQATFENMFNELSGKTSTQQQVVEEALGRLGEAVQELGLQIDEAASGAAQALEENIETLRQQTYSALEIVQKQAASAASNAASNQKSGHEKLQLAIDTTEQSLAESLNVQLSALSQSTELKVEAVTEQLLQSERRLTTQVNKKV